MSVKRNENWEPVILAFCCNWCTYTGADLAGLNRMQYPENVRVIRIPCSSRVNPQFIIRAFQKGVDGVLVCGCHPGDCHYSTGNYFTRRRFTLMQRLLEYNGIDPKRFQAKWISGSEAAKFRDTMIEVSAEIKKLGPNTKFAEEHYLPGAEPSVFASGDPGVNEGNGVCQQDAPAAGADGSLKAAAAENKEGGEA